MKESIFYRARRPSDNPLDRSPEPAPLAVRQARGECATDADRAVRNVTAVTARFGRLFKPAP